MAYKWKNDQLPIVIRKYYLGQQKCLLRDVFKKILDWQNFHKMDSVQY